ncbi:MAG: LysE family transporter [Endozoicomonadaceae bacterium]|nr:LysE family transporter [Endozoicomonadaceae bacterium]
MLDFSVYFNLWTFILLMIGTPGPANMLMMSTGAMYGAQAAFKLLMGLVISMLILNTLISFGVGALLTQLPMLKIILSILSVIFFSYFLLKNWNAQPKPHAEANPKVGFYAGIFVHILNPKAWIMVTLVNAQFIFYLETFFERYVLAPLSFAVVQCCLHSLWALLGILFNKKIASNLFLNRSLIILTLGVVVWSFFQSGLEC